MVLCKHTENRPLCVSCVFALEQRLFSMAVKKMKKLHKILLIIIVVEFAIIRILKLFNVSATTFWGNLLGIIFFFLPILILLYLLAKDSSNKKTQITYISILIFIIFCIIGGCIARVI